MSTTRLRNTASGAAMASAATMAVLQLAGCASDNGTPTTEQRAVSSFHSVDVRGAATVSVDVGPRNSLLLTGTPKALSRLTTEVTNGMLVVEVNNPWYELGRNRLVDMRITTPDLNAFAANGTVQVTIDDMRGDALALVLHGAGSIKASGEANLLNARLNGAGSMDLTRLTVRDATARVQGAGKLDLRVTSSLEAQIDGVGAIRYSGKPKTVEPKINGAGTIGPLTGLGT